MPSPGDHPNPGIEPRFPALQADSLPAEPPQKPKNTGVGSLCRLQWIFLTQGLNQGLLHSLPTELSGKLSDTEKGKSLGEWKMNNTRVERKPQNSDF